MSIDAVKNVNIAIETPSKNQQSNTTLSFRKNDYERMPKADTFQSDEKKGNGKKIAIGLGGVAALVTLAVLGRKGRLGDGIQKFLGGAKEAENKATESDTKKKFIDLYNDAIKNKKESVKNEITGKTHEFKYDENGKLTEEVVKYTDKDGNNISVKYQSVKNKMKNNEAVEQMKIVEIKNGDNVVSQRSVDKDGILVHKKAAKTEPMTETVTEEVTKNAEVMAEKAATKAEPAAEKAVVTEGAAAKTESVAETVTEEAAKKVESIKEQLIKEGKLNYQIEFKKNKIFVKNGEAENLVNEKGEPWKITEATDKDFVKELKQAINNENDKRVADELSMREGLDYLETQEKATKLKKIKSDENNKKWLREQHQVKEEEYSNWWNNALAQRAKETLFPKTMEQIGLYASGLKLNEEIVAQGQKFVFKNGKLEKILNANNKEVTIDKNVDFKEILLTLSKKYELEIVVPKLKKQISNVTSMYTENINNTINVFKDLKFDVTEKGKLQKITKNVADNEYTFEVSNGSEPFLKRALVKYKDGKKLEFYFDGNVISIKEGKDNYKFLCKKGNYKLISMTRDNNNCNIGDVTYYRIPYYKDNNRSAVEYKMPNYKEFDSNIHKFDNCSFYTDLRKYYSKQCLG